MDFGVMVVALAAIGCTYELIKRIVAPGPIKNQKEILDEIRALRDEVRQLRQENHDVILAFDSTLHSVDDRVERLEARAGRLGPGETSEERLPARAGDRG